MWNKISIRWQLIGLLSVVILIIEISALTLDYLNDVKQRKTLAVEQAETISRALQLDLLKAIVSPQADTYADITFRVSTYQSVVQLAVFNQNTEEVFRYIKKDFNMPFSASLQQDTQPIFSDEYLLIQQPISTDGHEFGAMAFVFDLASYNTGLREQLVNKLFLFGSQLVAALFLTWFISKNYTRPFTKLAETMQKADIRHGQFPTIETRSTNEIGTLYNGYNRLVSKIGTVTRELHYQSRHDSLTGLLNRFAMDQLIADALGDSSTKSNVLMTLDLDQFKLLNYAAGHVAGDEMLKQIGQIIATGLSRNYHLARSGGDDFSILLPDCGQADGIVQAQRLLEAVKEFRFTWNNDIHTVSCCIGLLSFKPGEFTPKSLNTAVDSAFYKAKSLGQNKLSVYTPDDEHIKQYNSDVQTIAIINDALKNGKSRFELFAQSIYPLQKKTDKISYEILLRLWDNNGEMVYPDLFLPAANRYQLMVSIDTHVLTGYLQAVINNKQHLAKLAFVNINLGGSTLNNPDFQNTLKQAIAEYDFPWNKLVLEVTETSAVGNLVQARDFIYFCREKGIRVALDDFGTGMASFEYLKHLPLDVVKIDGSFVRDMLTDPVDHAMVSYACEISKLQGRDTIAEFVEEKAHVEALTEIGIDYAQGYYIDKPKPLTDWLSA